MISNLNKLIKIIRKIENKSNRYGKTVFENFDFNFINKTFWNGFG